MSNHHDPVCDHHRQAWPFEGCRSMGDSDIRLVQPISHANRGIRGDGSDANISQTTQETRAHDVRRATDQTRRVTDGTGDNQRISTGTGTGARTQAVTTSDNFATTQASAWQAFMADMLSALDVALSAQDAAKDGKITSDEWTDIFGKATKDGQVSLLEISAMYAGLQDMHDKGALDDGEYKDGVASLERELSARYSGSSANGLDSLARMYLQTLDHDDGDAATAVTTTNRDVTRTQVSNDLNATLTDIGINRNLADVADVNDTRRGSL